MSDPAPPGPLTVLRDVARSDTLRRLFVGWFSFCSAEWGTWIAILVYAYDRGGATTAGIVAVTQLVPAAIAAPFAGAIADRRGPGPAIVAGQAAQAVTMAAVGLAMVTDAPQGLVYALATAYTIAFAVTRPAHAALLPQVTRTTPELVAANIVTSWVENGTTFVGPLAAGLVMTIGGPGPVFIAFAAGAAVATIVLMPLAARRVAATDGSGTGIVAEVLEGFRALRGRRSIAVVVAILTAGWVLLGTVDVLYVVLAAERGLGHGGAGLLNAAWGVGALVGGAGTILLIGRRRFVPPLVGGALVAGGALLLAATGATPAVLVALLALAGLGHAFLDVAGRTLLQRLAPDEVLARVFGLLECTGLLGEAAGTLIVPVLFALGGSPLALVGAGLLLPAVVLAAAVPLRGLDDGAPGHVTTALHRYPAFAPLGPAALEALAMHAVETRHAAGDTVIRQGEAGDRFYLVLAGAYAVAVDGRVINHLGPGEGFGEIALLRDVPRTATVTAESEGVVLALDRDAFVLAVTGHPAVHERFHEVADRRVPVGG